MAESVGYVALQVIPTVKGIEGNLAAQLGGPLITAGRKAGQDAGAAIANGIERSKADVEKATAVLAKAQDKVADATGRVRVETQKLTDAQNSGKTTAAQLAAAEERLESAVRKEAAAKRDAAKHTDALARANKSAADSGKKISSEIDTTTQKLGGLKGAAAKAGTAISDGLSKVGGRAQGAAAGGELGEGIMSGVTSKVGGLGGKAGPIGAALVGIAGVGLAAGAVLIGAITDGMEQQQDRALVQARLGISDAAMKNIGQAAGGAFSNAWGESMSANMSTAQAAIQSGLLDPNESVAVMQPVIEKLSLVSELMGEEIPAVSRAAGQAIKTGMVQDAAGAMDLFVKAQQNGLNVSEDFLDTVTEYSTQFRKLGLDGPEAFALVSQAVKNGARDTDVAADALKEFSIRVVDGSESSVAAFETLGLNALEMRARFASGGESARFAMSRVFDELSRLEDPVQRNTVSLGLFGTQAEDLGGALGAMNLDTAAAEFGQVAGAADAAADLVGNTAASKLQAAKNSIATSMDGVKLAMADAFAPALGKLADWVSTHKPEIIGFFVSLGDTVLGAADTFLGFSSTTLRVLADLNSFLGTTVGNMIGVLGGFAETAGGILSHLPGKMGDVGRSLEDAGRAAQGVSDKFKSGADQMRGMADSIDNSARPAIQGVREDFVNSGTAAQNSQILMRALGDSVTAIPNGKTITLTDNTPEATARLEALGLKVTTLPDGTVQVTANTAEGQAVIDGFVNQNSSMTIKAYVALQNRVSAGDLVVGGGSAWASKQADGGIISSYATGKLPQQALIQPAVGKRGLVQWAEGETGGEAFIPLAPGKRARSLAIWAETGKRLGVADGKMQNLAVQKLAGALGAVRDIKGSLGNLFGKGDYDGVLHRYGIEEDHPLIDAALSTRDGLMAARGVAGSVGNLFGKGDYDGVLSRYGIEEDNPLIDAALSGRDLLKMLTMADGGIVPGKDFAQSMDSADYLMGGFSRSAIDCSAMVAATINDALGLDPFSERMTTMNEGQWLAAKGALPGLGGPGDISVGWFDFGGGANGHTALTLGDGTNVESNGAEGVVIGGPVGADDSMFDQHAHIPAALLRGGDLGGGSAGGSAAGGLAGLGSGGAGGASGGSGGSGSGGSSSGLGGPSGSTGGTVQVFVTNWPGSTAALEQAGLTSPAVPTDVPADVPGFQAAPTTSGQPLLFGENTQPMPTPGGDGAAAQFGVETPKPGEPDRFGQFFQDAGQQWQGYFQDNWKEMLNTGVGLLLGGGRGGGGDTYNISGDPRTVATAIARQQARRTRALQLSGGMGR